MIFFYFLLFCVKRGNVTHQLKAMCRYFVSNAHDDDERVFNFHVRIPKYQCNFQLSWILLQIKLEKKNEFLTSSTGQYLEELYIFNLKTCTTQLIYDNSLRLIMRSNVNNLEDEKIILLLFNLFYKSTLKIRVINIFAA